MTAVGRLACAAFGALLARAALRAAIASADASPACAPMADVGARDPAVAHSALERCALARSSWTRRNYRGRHVSLAGGPALAVAASVSAAAGALASGHRRLAAASLVAGLGAGVIGGYDDVVGAQAGQLAAKGLAGHFAALRAGWISTGMVKLVGLPAVGLLAASTLPPRRRTRAGPALSPAGLASAGLALGRLPGLAGRVAGLALGAVVIAGTANLFNLLDLRPGRALKGGLLLGTPLAVGDLGVGSVAGPLGAAVALLPDDLGERVMLGDCGANAFGALLGVALATRCGPLGRVAAAAALISLTIASERVSFTAVIDRTPVLRALDRFGRRTD